MSEAVLAALEKGMIRGICSVFLFGWMQVATLYIHATGFYGI